MIAGLIEGKAPEERVWFARGPLKSKVQELLNSLDEPLGERHRLLLSTIHHHMGFLTEELPHIDDGAFWQSGEFSVRLPMQPGRQIALSVTKFFHGKKCLAWEEILV
ncbi:MAG: hypothetical protein CSA33_00185 [Desulfobulbus propionicus]|nr:MAG: hypothetical protein CSA33_00185 [Desulfobulbus propionicus]